MGNDGGDIPKRKELVKQRTKIQLADPKQIAFARSRYCNLTKAPLTLPLAICRLGNIYNYESLLSSLVSKTLPKKYNYIRKIADFKKVEVVMSDEEKGEERLIVCPISNMEYNGFNKFVALWGCGHVYSLKAVKEIKGEREKKCLVCGVEYKKDDVVDLNLTPEEQLKIKERITLKREMKEKHLKEESKLKEPELKKEFKVEEKEVALNKLEQLDAPINDIIKGRDVFKEVFHKEYKQGDNLFIRPVKIGMR